MRTTSGLSATDGMGRRNSMTALSGEFLQIAGDARKSLLGQQPEDCGKFEYGRHRPEPRRAEKSVLEFRRFGESPSRAGNNRLRQGRSPGQRKLLPGAASVASRKGGTADPADGWWASGHMVGTPTPPLGRAVGTGRAPAV